MLCSNQQWPGGLWEEKQIAHTSLAGRPETEFCKGCTETAARQVGGRRLAAIKRSMYLHHSVPPKVVPTNNKQAAAALRTAEMARWDLSRDGTGDLSCGIRFAVAGGKKIQKLPCDSTTRESRPEASRVFFFRLQVFLNFARLRYWGREEEAAPPAAVSGWTRQHAGGGQPLRATYCRC